MIPKNQGLALIICLSLIGLLAFIVDNNISNHRVFNYLFWKQKQENINKVATDTNQLIRQLNLDQVDTLNCKNTICPNGKKCIIIYQLHALNNYQQDQSKQLLTVHQAFYPEKLDGKNICSKNKLNKKMQTKITTAVLINEYWL